MPKINHSHITEREVEVVRLLAHGMTTTQIAKELHLSPHTVNSHRRNLMRKTNARNTVQMVSKVLAALPSMIAPAGILSMGI